MTKVKQPNKEFFESDQKPDCLKLSGTKDDLSGVVRFIRTKKKKLKVGIIGLIKK